MSARRGISTDTSSFYYISWPFNLVGFLKEYWLPTITLFLSFFGVLIPCIWRGQLNQNVAIVLFPANMFLRHIRGFVALFVLFASVAKARLFLERKSDPKKTKIWLKYLISGVLSLVVTFAVAYLLVPFKKEQEGGLWFKAPEIANYNNKLDFFNFLNHLAVHDIPLNLATTRLDVFNDFSKADLRDGLGDGYNAPGFVVFGLLIAGALYFLNDGGHLLTSAITQLHHCLLGVYWILVVYSPVAFFFCGFVVFDQIKQAQGLKHALLGYLFLTLAVVATCNIWAAVVLPLQHFVRTRRNPFPVLFKVAPYLPSAFCSGSSVLTVEKTADYLKRRGYDPNIVDRYLKFSSLVNFDGTASGFVVCAVVLLKLFGKQFDWVTLFKIFVTGFLVAFTIIEYIQGYLFGIIFFLNATMLPPFAIVLLLPIDWFLDRFRIVTNVINDAYTIDELEAAEGRNLDGRV